MKKILYILLAFPLWLSAQCPAGYPTEPSSAVLDHNIATCLERPDTFETAFWVTPRTYTKLTIYNGQGQNGFITMYDSTCTVVNRAGGQMAFRADSNVVTFPSQVRFIVLSSPTLDTITLGYANSSGAGYSPQPCAPTSIIAPKQPAGTYISFDGRVWQAPLPNGLYWDVNNKRKILVQ